MTTNKRITDLTDYTSVLPYASELFGVYQPMIGWRSQRMAKRTKLALVETKRSLLETFASNFRGIATTNFQNDCTAAIGNIEIGRLASTRLADRSDSVLLQTIADKLPPDVPPMNEAWRDFLDVQVLQEILNSAVPQYYTSAYQMQCQQLHRPRAVDIPGYAAAVAEAEKNLAQRFKQQVEHESALAGALVALLQQQRYAQLEAIFYRVELQDLAVANQQIAALLTTDDPFETFDPKQDIKNVSLSPLGIVHLFRQYFFELDTFLGTPTTHVWVSPGSTVELLETSTRRVYTERTIEQATESTQKSETSRTDSDEISEAVKEDNKTDLKLGATLTVNQSWGTGDATATGSLNMDTTQDTARETTHKRMREQTEKLSSEIKQNYKSTFKTITENTDTSSKRYILTNSTPDLINYELRRKMRQVGVQVQDIGSYLCWETFVDEPGRDLGLANLVNIAKPADLVAVPDPNEIPIPDDKPVTFTTNLTWNYGDNRQFNGPEGYLPMNDAVPVPPAPDGYDVKYPADGFIDVFQASGTGEDFSGVWAFRAKFRSGSFISVGPFIGPDGLEWDETINFVVGGVVMFTPNTTKRKDIADANTARIKAGITATVENARKTKEAYVTAAKQRIDAASGIKTRRYEDLREEERIIVYRKLIGDLMTDALYNLPESTTNDRMRHTLAELVNSIFDIDKMLYFVAPEWWKPRKHYHQYLANNTNDAIFASNLTNWSDLEARSDNYYITETSQPARMGSSLGWLLQLDGDDLRNAFLNAPWVKAVIPIRPGKELEASNWLQQVHVEGTDGLDNLYQAPADELQRIRQTLNINDVTIADAIRYLCAEVALKYKESLKVGRYPKDEINDDNKVNATPVDKVYEHGFYPLKGGFRAITSRGPDGRGESYEVFDQWIEVLPTDQIVPVEVTYDPRTGRQTPP